MKKQEERNRVCYAGALFAVLISTIFSVTLQFLKGDVLDFAIAGQLQSAFRYAALLIVFILCEVLFHFLYAVSSARFAVGCTKRLKRDILSAIMHRSYVSYREHAQGEYIAMYTNEADTIQECRFKMLPMFWEILFKIVLVSAALFVLDWRIALVTLALLTTPLYIPKLIEKRLQKAQAEQLDAVERNLAKVHDWLNGFEVIKNFSAQGKILQIFDAVNDETAKKKLHNAELGAMAQLITTLISYLSYFIVLICSAWLVLRGEFSAGDFFIAIGMIDQLSYPLIALAGIIRQLISIRPACMRMEEFISEGEKQQAGSSLPAVKQKIEYKNVSFAYPGQNPILNHFSFTAEKGKRYWIKGPSGCGKTTTINLLLRYYDVKAGTITVDGAPISQFADTYDCMTVVRQEAVLFCDSLRSNLTMYRDIPDETILEVLDRVGLGKFASKAALDEMVAESGSNLSGGEKKRICLARALLRDTDVLILDEPLANLDEPTAAKIEDLLLSISDKLVLIVSHQFTPEKVQQFDRVIAL